MMTGQFNLNKLIYDAVLKLCCEQLNSENSKRLEIDGIICIATDEPKNQIVVKIHEKLRNVNSSSSFLSSRSLLDIREANSRDAVSVTTNNHVERNYLNNKSLEVSALLPAVSDSYDGRRTTAFVDENGHHDMSSLAELLPSVKQENCNIMENDDISDTNTSLQTYGSSVFPETVHSVDAELSTSAGGHSSLVSTAPAILPTYCNSAETPANDQGSILGKLLTSAKRHRIRTTMRQHRGHFKKCVICGTMFKNHSHLRAHLCMGYCGKSRLPGDAGRLSSPARNGHDSGNSNLNVNGSAGRVAGLNNRSVLNSVPTDTHDENYQITVKEEPPDNGYENPSVMEQLSNNNSDSERLQNSIIENIQSSTTTVDQNQSMFITYPLQSSTLSSSSRANASLYKTSSQRAFRYLSHSTMRSKNNVTANTIPKNSGQKPHFSERRHFQCSYCSFEISDWVAFEQHSQREHNRSLCKVCGAAFTFRTNKNRHEKTCAGLILFTCEICGKNCKRSDALRLHKVKAHPWRVEISMQQ